MVHFGSSRGVVCAIRQRTAINHGCFFVLLAHPISILSFRNIIDKSDFMTKTKLITKSLLYAAVFIIIVLMSAHNAAVHAAGQPAILANKYGRIHGLDSGRIDRSSPSLEHPGLDSSLPSPSPSPFSPFDSLPGFPSFPSVQQDYWNDVALWDRLDEPQNHDGSTMYTAPPPSTAGMDSVPTRQVEHTTAESNLDVIIPKSVASFPEAPSSNLHIPNAPLSPQVNTFHGFIPQKPSLKRKRGVPDTRAHESGITIAKLNTLYVQNKAPCGSALEKKSERCMVDHVEACPECNSIPGFASFVSDWRKERLEAIRKRSKKAYARDFAQRQQDVDQQGQVAQDNGVFEKKINPLGSPPHIAHGIHVGQSANTPTITPPLSTSVQEHYLEKSTQILVPSPVFPDYIINSRTLNSMLRYRKSPCGDELSKKSRICMVQHVNECSNCRNVPKLLDFVTEWRDKELEKARMIYMQRKQPQSATSSNKI